MKNKTSAKRKPAVTKGFSALTFNLRFGLADDGVNSWDHRKKALPAMFKKYRPDFIGLQETNDFQIDWILYRGNISPVNYSVVVSTFEGIYPSDHFPVYAKFRWIDKH